MRWPGHAHDATAGAGVGQPPRRWLSRAAPGPVFLAAALMTACGDPVGDQRGGFEVDPAPVLGVWVEREPTDNPPREAFIEAGAGFLTGQFEFEHTQLVFRVPFTGGGWDGERLTFTTGDIFGAGGEPIDWTALLVPASADDPALLRLFPTVGGSVPFSVEYERP